MACFKFINFALQILAFAQSGTVILCDIHKDSMHVTWILQSLPLRLFLLRNQGLEHMPRMHCSLLCNPANPPLCFGCSHFCRQMSPRLTQRERSKQRKVELVGENINQ